MIVRTSTNSVPGVPVTLIAVNKVPSPTDILLLQELAKWIRLKFTEATEGDEEK